MKKESIRRKGETKETRLAHRCSQPLATLQLAVFSKRHKVPLCVRPRTWQVEESTVSRLSDFQGFISTTGGGPLHLLALLTSFPHSTAGFPWRMCLPGSSAGFQTLRGLRISWFPVERTAAAPRESLSIRFQSSRLGLGSHLVE